MNTEYISGNRSNPHEGAMRVAAYLTAVQKAASYLEGGERLMPIADIALFHERLKRREDGRVRGELEELPYSPLVQGFLQLVTPTVASLIGEERCSLA